MGIGALVYWALAVVTMRYLSPDGHVAVVWIPGGVALAATLMGGPHFVLAAGLGALISNLAAGVGVASIAVALGNAAGTWCAWQVVRREGSVDDLLWEPRAGVILGIAGVVAGLVSSSTGVGVYALLGRVPPEQSLRAAASWLEGDILGALLVTPLVFVWRTFPRDWFRGTRWVETVLCFGLAWLLGQLVLVGWHREVARALPGGSTMLVFVVWAALRFGRHGAFLIATMIAVQANAGTIRGTGIFAGDLSRTGILSVFLFLLLAVGIGTALSTAITRRRSAEQRLRSAEDELRSVGEKEAAERALEAERERARVALSASEQKFRTVFDEAPIVIVLSDPVTYKVLEVNAEAERLFGFSRDLAIGRSGLELGIWVDPSERERSIAAFRRDGRVAGMEVRLRRPGGDEEFPALFSAVMVEVGGRRCLLFTFQDISDLKRAESELEAAVLALQTSVSLLEATLESTADGILVVGEDRRITRFNRRFAELWRIPDDVLDSRDDARAIGHVLSQLADPDAFVRTVERLYADPSASSFDVLVFKDGREFERYSRPQRVAGRTVGRVWSFRDITDRRRAELGQRALEERLRQAQKLEAVGTLAGGIAHDFNNILAAIVGYSELATLDLPEGAPARAEIEQVLRASRRATSLVRRILTFSRAEPGMRTIIRLDGVVRETLEFLRASLPASVELASDLGHEEVRILADATQVNQVVMNLCTNAWQAMGMDGGRISVRQTVEAVDEDRMHKEGLELRPGPYAILSVSDTGSGIPPEFLPRIFDPFFTTKPAGEGTGLGLAMVHGIMRAHDGAVTVRSEVGSGTVFTLWFPVVDGGADAAPLDAPARQGHGEHVLLVDDEPTVSAVTARIVEILGYRVSAFTTPESALEAFTADPEDFDLVLTDLTMPHMTGIALAERIRRRRPGMPIIISTGYADAESEKRLRELGVTYVLAKPPSIQKLAEALRVALGTHA